MPDSLVSQLTGTGRSSPRLGRTISGNPTGEGFSSSVIAGKKIDRSIAENTAKRNKKLGAVCKSAFLTI
jgi:hypothetical protein